jgi:hypothetical protein
VLFFFAKKAASFMKGNFKRKGVRMLDIIFVMTCKQYLLTLLGMWGVGMATAAAIHSFFNYVDDKSVPNRHLDGLKKRNRRYK